MRYKVYKKIVINLEDHNIFVIKKKKKKYQVNNYIIFINKEYKVFMVH